MTRSTVVKVAIVIILGISSSAVTKSILRAQKRGLPGGPRRASVVASDRVSKVKTVASPPANRLDAFSGEQVPKGLTGRFSLEKFNVEPQNNAIIVGAQAFMQHNHPFCSYMWNVRILNANTEVVVRKLDYSTQIFNLEPGTLSRPTFQDKFDLLPGRYVVYLRLYSICPGIDPANVSNSYEDMSNVALADFAHITLR